MNKKIIAVATLATILLAGVSSAFAQNNTQNTSTQTSTQKEMRWPKIDGKTTQKLTTEEQNALTSMTESQKREFFEKKRAEKKAKRTAQENVIDKLLAGETLTAEEEKIRQEIISERKVHAEKKAEMKAKKNTTIQVQ